MKTFQPDFSYMLSVLEKKPTDRPVLFEFYMNETVYDFFTKEERIPQGTLDFQTRYRMMMAFKHMGYDYVTLLAHHSLLFPTFRSSHENSKTYSLNESPHIGTWESFENYPWPNYDQIDFSYLESLVPYLPEGMKFIPSGPNGVEEIVISLTGYENLCILMYDNPELVTALFDAVGSRLTTFYKAISSHDAVGACISNDDWGFNTQTLFSEDQMEKYVFPWHKKISEAIHQAGKPAILHSCGNIYPIFHWITEEIQYDGKHSFEDSIMPIEDAWDRYHSQIALLGGIDVNYAITEEVDTIYRRARNLIERTKLEGAFALGTGNSVPEYFPLSKFIAILQAAWDCR